MKVSMFPKMQRQFTPNSLDIFISKFDGNTPVFEIEKELESIVFYNQPLTEQGKELIKHKLVKAN